MWKAWLALIWSTPARLSSRTETEYICLTTLYLVRHGQTDWNIQGRWQGHADIPLNAVGRQQAEQIARSLASAGLSALFSSDLQRAAATAEAVSTMTGLPVNYDPRLREIHQGEWQGLVMGEVEARYSDLLAHSKVDPLNVAPPGGETVLEVRDRLVRAVEDICRRHPLERVALVSHGFALALIWVHYRNIPMLQVWDHIPPNVEYRVLEIPPRRLG